MALANGEVLKVVVPVELEDGTITNQVFHWKANVTSDLTNGNVLSSVGAWLDQMYGHIETLMAATANFLPYYMTKVTFDDINNKWVMEALIGEVASTVVPSDVNEAMPNQMAATIRATTLRPKSAGRKFIPAFTEGHQDAGILSGAAVTALGDFVDDYIADIDFGTVGQLSPGVPRTNADTFLDFFTGVVNDIMGTQRKRKPGVGT